jgi:peptidoglycan/LPS O-acetylase OafA/YrhL
VQSPVAQGRTSGRITEIDTFRAWAVLSVLLFHYAKEFYPGQESFFLFGWSGVDLFFVISGFVMYLQVTRKYATDERIFYRKYFRNRFLRIAPAFYVSLLAEVIFLHRDKLFSKEFFMHLSFTHIFSYDVAFSIQPIYWTLAVEVQFYLFLILTARLMSGKKAVASLGVLMLLSLVYRFVVAGIHGYSHTGVLLINQLPGRMPQFIAGMLLALIYMREDLRQFIRKRQFFILLSGIIIYGACGFHWLRGGDGIFENMLTETLFHPFLGVSFAMIMTVLLHEEGPLRSALRFKPLVFTGLISYSIYLWHFFLLEVVNVSGIRKTDIPSFIIIVSAVIVVYSISSLSYYFIEKQFLKLKEP